MKLNLIHSVWNSETITIPHQNQIKNNQHFIIRSTVYPGTTDFLYNFFRNNNKKIKLSFCPERFIQGSAIIEWKKTPQIIGSVNEASY